MSYVRNGDSLSLRSRHAEDFAVYRRWGPPLHKTTARDVW